MAEKTEENPTGVGAPVGNTNSNKNNRLWADTIRRAIIQSDGERLRRIAETLITKAEDGDMNAIKEIGDRLDGKAVAITELSGPDGSAIPVSVGLDFVKANRTVS
jgi:hypothetical protein